MDISKYIKNIKINSCGISDCDASWSWDTGKNGFCDFDLWTVLRGNGKIRTENRGEIKVQSGSSLLLLPYTHYIGEHDKDDPLLVVNVHFSFAVKFQNEENTPFIYHKISDITYFRDLLYRVLRLYNSGNISLAETVFSAAMVEYISQDDVNTASKYGADKPELIKRICDTVNTEPSGKILLSEFAKEYGYSADYLGRVFSATVGISFSEYVTNARINKGKFLLCSTGMSVEEIAEALGYYDTCYFIHQFKRSTGYSPGKYRKEKAK